MRMRGGLFRTFISGASVRFDQNRHMMMATKPSFFGLDLFCWYSCFASRVFTSLAISPHSHITELEDLQVDNSLSKHVYSFTRRQ